MVGECKIYDVALDFTLKRLQFVLYGYTKTNKNKAGFLKVPGKNRRDSRA